MNDDLPKTVDEAVDQIISEMILDEKVRIARLPKDELTPLKLIMRAYVKERLEESGINEELKDSCMAIVGEELDEAEASTVIIDALWERLTKSHGLRVVDHNILISCSTHQTDSPMVGWDNVGRIK